MLQYLSVGAQQTVPKETFYLFDVKDNPVNERGKAAAFEVITKENDTVFVVRYYQNYGSMIWQQTFRDSALTVANGRFAWYDKHGFLDSTGMMRNGVKVGKWDYFDSTQKKNLMNNIKSDNKKITIDNYASSGFSPKMLRVWKKYLTNNLNPKTGQYNSVYKTSAGNNAVVVVSFTVTPNKTTEDIYFLYSEAYPYDKEVLRVIGNANFWLSPLPYSTPATPLKETLRIIFPFQSK
jgi:hypothetical protein